MILLNQAHAILGDTSFCSESARTQDINFFDLCADYTLQCKLLLVTAAFLKPAYAYQEATKVENMPNKVAIFLSQFQEQAEQTKVKDFLLANPTIRILWLR